MGGGLGFNMGPRSPYPDINYKIMNEKKELTFDNAGHYFIDGCVVSRDQYEKEEMNQRFNRIEKKIDRIEKKINSILDLLT